VPKPEKTTTTLSIKLSTAATTIIFKDPAPDHPEFPGRRIPATEK